MDKKRINADDPIVELTDQVFINAVKDYKPLTETELGILDILTKEKPIKDSGERRTFKSGAVRDMEEGKGRCDLLPACALLRLARHYESGATKYDDRNWEKGIPISSMIDSGMRHLLLYLDGAKDEDHLVAAAWNLMGAMWMEEKKPEMQDIPSRVDGEQSRDDRVRETAEKLRKGDDIYE